MKTIKTKPTLIFMHDRTGYGIMKTVKVINAFEGYLPYHGSRIVWDEVPQGYVHYIEHNYDNNTIYVYLTDGL